MHESYLNQALSLAQQYRGYCAPNPAVGAVLVDNGQIIASGAHTGSGNPHAEIEAIKQAKHITDNTVLYVTLEPCSHWGKTPPCVNAIIEAGIKHVLFAFQDPNPIVDGNGRSLLMNAGVRCEQVEVAAVNDFYQSYAYWLQHKKPFVTAKLALSLDGKIAGVNGSPLAITGAKAKQFTHQLRNHSDAILTTAKTICNDDPQLNVRLANVTKAKPIYILEGKTKVPSNAQIFKTAKSVTILHDKNCESILSQIAKDGIHDLMIEAGGICFNEFVKQGLVNRAVLYLSKKVLGTQATAAALDTGIFNQYQLQDRYHLEDDLVYEFVKPMIHRTVMPAKAGIQGTE